MNIAIVHDWLNQRGGAEDVLETLTTLYPNQPIYTSLYAPDIMPTFYQNWDIHTLWTDKLPAIHAHHQPYLPLYPVTWGGLDLSQYDIVLSNKSGFCHGFQHTKETLHICYCLAPTRYVWQLEHYIAREGLGKPIELALRPLIAAMRRWDFAAAQRVNHFIAISTEIQTRIKQYYQRESTIIYPPVDTTRFVPVSTPPEDYFLVLSRLIPYKRIDLAIQAAIRLGVRLVIGGKGRDMERLQAMAAGHSNIEFLGYVSDEDVPNLMARCKAFLFPGLEDFGITPVQAQAAGRPVIAFAGGGALDTVIPGMSGELFNAHTVESLAAVMEQFDQSRYDSATMRAHAQKFDTQHFNAQISTYVSQAWDDFKK